MDENWTLETFVVVRLWKTGITDGDKVRSSDAFLLTCEPNIVDEDDNTCPPLIIVTAAVVLFPLFPFLKYTLLLRRC